MTYGWMLLVVAIVGGAIFATVSGQCLNDVTGFTGDDIEVTDYAAADNGDGEGTLELVMTNTAAESVTVNSVEILQGDETVVEHNEETADGDDQISVSVGGESSVNMHDADTDALGEVSDVEACNDYNIEVTYEREGFDITESASGNINANLQLDAEE